MADEPFPRAGEQGTVLAERYRLGARIGRGGMADVYAAQDELLHRSVAVKVFHSDGPEENERQRVEAEIRTLAGLRHPGLVTVFDAGVLVRAADDATPFLVMELIHGQTLRHRLADGPMPPSEAAPLGAGLASTLAYVHAKGVVHRDVKPANILLDEDAAQEQGRYTAKLTDFGIARLVDSTRLTMVGMTIGTANYLSPEQATGQVTGPASDVYALGLVLLECLTGQLAYPGTGVEAAMARLNYQPAIPISLGPGWVQVLTAMTGRDPSLRPTASATAQALTELGERAETGSSITDGSTAITQVVTTSDHAPQGTLLLPSRRAPRRRITALRWPWLAVAGAVLAMVLIVVIINSGHGSSSGSPSPAPSYPTVPGPIGTHLRQLEGAVG
jgi:eukaryotic-like serine/threonine-protein kinase